ncbi:MAG TPA: NADH-quinone oxidoreductase subunit A [Asticcacaulis sp.]|nr:NADH-quinone oxidoreductase subunit A [Asticcacaulis sp.]
MTAFFLQYLPIVIFLAIAIFIGVLFIGLGLTLAPQAPDTEKLSAYECGFNAFDSARHKFDVRFYLVSILFIVFDLEAAFLFPWAVSLFDPRFHAHMIPAFWAMVGFIVELLLGYIYVWKKGALEWE